MYLRLISAFCMTKVVKPNGKNRQTPNSDFKICKILYFYKTKITYL